MTGGTSAGLSTPAAAPRGTDDSWPPPAVPRGTAGPRRPAGGWRGIVAGLRTRLLVAFVLVTLVGAAVAAVTGAVLARGALLEENQRQAAATVSTRIAGVAPTLDLRPDEATDEPHDADAGSTAPPAGQVTLDRLRDAVGGPALVVHGNRTSATGMEAGLVPAELREAVAGGDRLVTQRVVVDGTPWLLVGTPLVTTAPDGTRTPSGIEVYAARDLTAVQERVGDLTARALGTAALVVPLPLLLALLAARSVLRPVRDLRDTARRLAAGDLGARTPPRGSDELADLARTVNHMAGSVQTSMTAMSRMEADSRRFAADVSHELRTPLATLTAVMDVLDDTTGDLRPEAREAAELAIAETHRLVRLVEDLMEVSRFDAGTAHLRLEDRDVTAVVRETLRTRGWTDRVELDAPAGVPARFDARRIDVVVANLVGNALRHGGPPVRVRVSASTDTVRVEVSDGGPGLPDDVIDHVFDRFYKADAARTRSTGSGLGLAIARANARLHDGDLTVANRIGPGDTAGPGPAAGAPAAGRPATDRPAPDALAPEVSTADAPAGATFTLTLPRRPRT